MKNFPIELKINICLFLDPQSLCRLASVSKNWKQFSEDEKIWQEKLSKITSYKNANKSSKAIFSEITKLKNQTPNYLLQQASQNTECAKLILQTPDLTKIMTLEGLLTKSDLFTLAQSCVKTAEYILTTPKLLLSFDTDDLFNLAQSSAAIAKVVLQNFTFNAQKCKRNLLDLADLDSEVKKMIFSKYHVNDLKESQIETLIRKTKVEIDRKFHP